MTNVQVNAYAAMTLQKLKPVDELKKCSLETAKIYT